MPSNAFPSNTPVVDRDESEDSGDVGRLDPGKVADQMIPRGGRLDTGGATPEDVKAMPAHPDRRADRTPVEQLRSAPGFRPPSSSAALTDGSTRRVLKNMKAFPPEHDVSPPARLTKACGVVVEQIDAALAALERVAEVPQQRQTWRAQVMADTEAAYRAGKTAPDERARHDFEGMEDRAVAEARGLVARARDARAAYDDLAEELLSADSRRETLEKALAQAHTEALQAAQDAYAKAEAAETAYRALLGLPRHTGLEHDPRQNLYLPRISEHITALTAELRKLDPERPVLVDTGKTRADMATRAGLANAGDPGSRWSIYMLERSEGFKVSSFTKDWPLLSPVPGAHNYELNARSPRY